MKVLYVACQDSPFDHNAGSGKDYEIYNGLRQNGAELVVAGPYPFCQTLSERIYRKVHRMFIRKRPVKYTDSFLARAADDVEKSIVDNKPDVIFSKYLSILSRVQTSIPIVVLSDTTLAGSQREWPIFTRAAYLKQNRSEQKGYDMAQSIIVHSLWSVEDLVKSYHQPLSKIHMFPCPASIPGEIVPKTITPKDNLSPLKILINGREYTRKGIDIAIDVVRQLNYEGIPANLRIVGLNGESDPEVKYMGLYNKTHPQELRAYISNYEWAHFLIHPARFEAAGIVPAEAAAFGVPTITNDVGGLATTVAHGISGIVLPKHSPSDEYVKVFQKYIAQPEEYRKLSLSTRQRYDRELNSEAASKWLYQVCLDASGCDS